MEVLYTAFLLLEKELKGSWIPVVRVVRLYKTVELQAGIIAQLSVGNAA
jgi:hypothetical protein